MLDKIKTLPTTEYGAPAGETLELWDKSEMPYLEEEENTNSNAKDRRRLQRDSSLHHGDRDDACYRWGVLKSTSSGRDGGWPLLHSRPLLNLP